LPLLFRRELSLDFFFPNFIEILPTYKDPERFYVETYRGQAGIVGNAVVSLEKVIA